MTAHPASSAAPWYPLAMMDILRPPRVIPASAQPALSLAPAAPAPPPAAQPLIYLPQPSTLLPHPSHLPLPLPKTVYAAPASCVPAYRLPPLVFHRPIAFPPLRQLQPMMEVHPSPPASPPRTVPEPRQEECLADMTARMACFLWYGRPSPPPACSLAGGRGGGADGDSRMLFARFCRRLFEATRVTSANCLLALLYIYRYRRAQPNVRGSPGCEYRLLTVALLLANKFLDDSTYTARTWADVSGIPVREVVVMEVEFLAALDYKLWVDPHEFAGWKERVEQWTGMGDGLLVSLASNFGSPALRTPLRLVAVPCEDSPLMTPGYGSPTLNLLHQQQHQHICYHKQHQQPQPLQHPQPLQRQQPYHYHQITPVTSPTRRRRRRQQQQQHYQQLLSAQQQQQIQVVPEWTEDRACGLKRRSDEDMEERTKRLATERAWYGVIHV
ncbi:uncharacterized protein VTP21DRAFT_6143 [Calcarisporiella thermophila]|uniref:uncharacterized protein n=1 Tax=Calcarisporiella thermophila TaxID=911321 RepID=UPI003743F924